ncbi:hypothetical protein Tco_0688960 [Tanacetum coccineum]
MLVIKIFSGRKKVFRERKKCEKIRVLRRKEERSLINTSFLDEYECSSLALEWEGRDDKKRLDHLKKDLIEVVFDGAFGGVRDEEVVVGEGVVVISSSLDMLTNNCIGGIMVSLIFLEGLDEEALVEFMVE